MSTEGKPPSGTVRNSPLHGGNFRLPSSIPSNDPNGLARIGKETPPGAQVARGRFGPGNRVVQDASNPITNFKRRIKEVYNKVKGGRLEPHTGSVLIQCLRFELDLYDRFEVGARLAKFDAEVAQLEARYSDLKNRQVAGSA